MNKQEGNSNMDYVPCMNVVPMARRRKGGVYSKSKKLKPFLD